MYKNLVNIGLLKIYKDYEMFKLKLLVPIIVLSTSLYFIIIHTKVYDIFQCQDFDVQPVKMKKNQQYLCSNNIINIINKLTNVKVNK